MVESQVTESLVASEPPTIQSTAWLYQPSLSGSLLGVKVTVGGVPSRYTVTDCEEVPPALVAEQVSVVLVVSEAIVVVSQPVEVNDDSGSVTLQLTITSLVYQPLLPKVPETVGLITGGVVSEGAQEASGGLPTVMATCVCFELGFRLLALEMASIVNWTIPAG